MPRHLASMSEEPRHTASCNYRDAVLYWNILWDVVWASVDAEQRDSIQITLRKNCFLATNNLFLDV